MDVGTVTLSIPAAVAVCATAAGTAVAATVWIVTAIGTVRDAVKGELDAFRLHMTGEIVALRERVSRVEARLDAASEAHHPAE